jgi:hypothetical protein
MGGSMARNSENKKMKQNQKACDLLGAAGPVRQDRKGHSSASNPTENAV